MKHRQAFFRILTVTGLLSLLITGTTWAQPKFVPGQVIVKGSPDSLPDHAPFRVLPHSGLMVIETSRGGEWGLVTSLKARGYTAGLNYIVKMNATIDDPVASYQWHFDLIGARDAWDISDGLGTIVAVLDTGLAANGPDGIGCVLPGRDFVNDDDDPTDGEGHGTHVSGTVAAATNNGIGVAGLAHGACIMPVKVLDDTGYGDFAGIAEGIAYAVDNGADVINMSLSVDSKWPIYNDPIVDPILDYAYMSGVVVVCAAGNEGSRRQVAYPSSYTTTISVGATDFNNSVTRYSNRGDLLDFVAPGGDITKDLNGDGYADGVLQETFDSDGWNYFFYQGTSMAAPHVTALAALLISAGVATTPDEVYQVIQDTALDLGNSGYDNAYGHGLIQAYAALTGTVPPVCEPTTEICDDGIDNDCDLAVDLDDSDCSTGDETCDLGALGDSCSSGAECCSNKCAGKPGNKTCK